MLEFVSSSSTSAPRTTTNPAYLLQRNTLERPSLASVEIQVESHVSTAQSAKIGSIVLWAALGVFFFALVFGYPLVLSILGDSHGIRYLIRLGSSLLVLTFMVLFVGVVNWLTHRE